MYQKVWTNWTRKWLWGRIWYSHISANFPHSLAGSPCGASGDDTKLLHDRATGGCLPRGKHMFFFLYFSQQSIPGQNCWGWAYQGVSRYHLLHTHRDTVQLQQIWLYIILLYDIRYYTYIYTFMSIYTFNQWSSLDGFHAGTGFAKIQIDPTPLWNKCWWLGVSHLTSTAKKPSKVSISVSATLAGKAGLLRWPAFKGWWSRNPNVKKLLFLQKKLTKWTGQCGTSSKMNTIFFC